MPVDVVCRLLVPVLEDAAATGDVDRDRKLLARDVFNSIVEAVGHDRALRGYNAARTGARSASGTGAWGEQGSGADPWTQSKPFSSHLIA